MKIKFKGYVNKIDDLKQALRACFMDCFNICEDGDGCTGKCCFGTFCTPVEITIEIKKTGRAVRIKRSK